ncbi:MAG: DUF5335 family protein [Janthinobacterium lividum]
MPTREIARTEWKTYFDDFSKTRGGELVSVELIFSPQADPQYALDKEPLLGITYEEKGNEPGTIEISAGGEENNSLTHTVTNPVHVYHKNARGLISEEINVDEVLEITSSDDPRIIYLRFTPAA